MINLKKLLKTTLMVSFLVSLNANCHVCSLNKTSLTISSGAYVMHPIHAESNLYGVGGELDFYIFRPSRFGLHGVIQISYIENNSFGLGKSYNIHSTTSSQATISDQFKKDYQGGMKDNGVSGRISIGKETIFYYEDAKHLKSREKNCSCIRLYSGLGIAMENNRLKSKRGSGFAKGRSTAVSEDDLKDITFITKYGHGFTVDKLDAYAIIPGIDLRLSYPINRVMISPEIFIGLSLYGKSNYIISYVHVHRDKKTGKLDTYPVKALQAIGANIYICIPITYNISNSSSLGIRFNFKGNYRGLEERHVLVQLSARGTKIKHTILDSVAEAISLQFTHTIA